MARLSDPGKVREWRRRMGRFEKSGLSVVQFCRKEGVSAPSFYQWRKRLQQQRAGGEDASHPAAAPASFRAVRVVGTPSVTIRLPGGTRLDVSSADPKTLQLAIEAVAQMDAQRSAGDRPC